MLHIQELYNELGLGINDFAVHLEQELGIKCKKYPEHDLYVFNYSQTESPKTHPIVLECRGLIVSGDMSVVCKPFDRFFNIGEALDITSQLDFDSTVCYEKLDGSFIKVFYYEDMWHIATRGTAFAETENYTGVIFERLVLDAFGVKDKETFSMKMDNINPEADRSYFFEYTSPSNRVVTPYTESKMFLLGDSSDDCWNKWAKWEDVAERFRYFGLNCEAAKYYKFTSETDMRDSVLKLPNLEEGYVCLDYKNKLRVKVKSPAYVAAHRLRGDNGVPSPKNICAMVVTNEYDEYFAYFPEDKVLFTPYIDSYNDMLYEMENYWNKVRDIEDQKEFAMIVKDHKWSWCFFQAKKSKLSPKYVFTNAKEKIKVDTLINFHSYF